MHRVTENFCSAARFYRITKTSSYSFFVLSVGNTRNICACFIVFWLKIRIRQALSWRIHGGGWWRAKRGIEQEVFREVLQRASMGVCSPRQPCKTTKKRNPLFFVGYYGNCPLLCAMRNARLWMTSAASPCNRSSACMCCSVMLLLMCSLHHSDAL